MPATPKWVPNAPGLVEDAASGEYSFADTQTFTQIYNGRYADCVAGAVPKGTVGSGATAGYIVQSCKVTKAGGERGRLMIVWEGYGGGGGVLPEDEFGLDPQDLNPATEKHTTFNSVTPEQFAWVTTAIFNAEETSATAARDRIIAAGGQVKKLYDVMKRGNTNFYKPCFTYYWIQHFTSQPSFNTGGYTETPGGPLGSTISGLGLSCLREADKIEYSGGIWRRTRTWRCVADSYWDPILYT